jgi:hypothetical protein
MKPCSAIYILSCHSVGIHLRFGGWSSLPQARALAAAPHNSIFMPRRELAGGKRTGCQ